MDSNMRQKKLLSDMESSVLLAAAEGMSIATIAEVDGSEEEHIEAVCSRAMSVVRHPASPRSGFTEEELQAARRLSERSYARQRTCRMDNEEA